MSQPNGVTTNAHDEVVWVTVHTARMDEASTERMRQEVTGAAGRKPTLPVVLDMTGVQFLPSLTLGALVALNRDFRQAGRRFMFVGVQPMVRQMFALTRLDRLFEIHPSIDEALARLREAR